MKNILVAASLAAALGLASASAMAQQQTPDGSFQASDYSPPTQEAGARTMPVSATPQPASSWRRADVQTGPIHSGYNTGVRSFDDVYFGQ